MTQRDISGKDSAALNFKLEVTFQLASVTGQISLSPRVKEAIRQAQLRAAPGAPVEGPAFIEIIQDGRVTVKQHTDVDGRYKVPNLLPGIYQVRAFNGKFFSEMQTVQLNGGEFSLTFKFALLPEEEVYNFPNPVVVSKDGARANPVHL